MVTAMKMYVPVAIPLQVVEANGYTPYNRKLSLKRNYETLRILTLSALKPFMYLIRNMRGPIGL